MSQTVAEFFGGNIEARAIYEAVRAAVEESVGPVTIVPSKSQIAFKTGAPAGTFAAVWMPEQYLKRKAAPLVLTIFLRERVPSPRWKEVVEPAPGRFTHHLELYAVEDIDDEVRGWLKQAAHSGEWAR